MPNGTGNFRNFQISRKKDNLVRLTEICEMNFRKFSVPFDSEPEFSEILVEWNTPLLSETLHPRGLRFPVPLDKGKEGSGNEIVPRESSFLTAHTSHAGLTTFSYGGLQLSHQIQITHIKFKLLTSNSNHSHQIQITHIKFKSLTSNSNRSHQIQIAHIKFKSLTSNSNRSHQIQIALIKFKSLTSNSNRSHQIQIAHIKFKSLAGQRLSQ